MRPICLLLSLFLLAWLPAQAGHTPKAVLYLRVHVQTSGVGLPETQATTISIPPNGENIQIRGLPEATESDLAEVKTDAQGKVRLIFNHRGKVNLSAATAQNQGRILVVFINGTIVYAPIIDEQITDGELDIPAVSPATMQLLQETVAQNYKDGIH